MKFCEHDCTSECRRNGCSCQCGDYHLTHEEQEQLALEEVDAYEDLKNQEVQVLNTR